MSFCKVEERLKCAPLEGARATTPHPGNLLNLMTHIDGDT